MRRSTDIGFRVAPAARLSSRGLVLSETVHRPSARHANHAHDTAYFDIVLAGAHTERFHGGGFSLCRSSLAYRPAGWEHRNRVSSHGVRCFNVELGKDWLERHDVAILPNQPLELADTRMKATMLRLLRELHAPDGFSALVIDGLALELTGHSLRCADRGRPPAWLRIVTEAVRTGKDDIPSNSSLARMAGVHPSHLARTMRRFIGCSVGELIRDQRLRAAAERIRRSREPLSTIAVESGFCDQAHLTRAMRHAMGVTPGELRRQAARTTDSKRVSGSKTAQM